MVEPDRRSIPAALKPIYQPLVRHFSIVAGIVEQYPVNRESPNGVNLLNSAFERTRVQDVQSARGAIQNPARINSTAHGNARNR